MSPILLHRPSSGLVIEIDRPKQLGALDTDSFDRIEAALEQARQDSSVAWVALHSRLEKGFCAGGDVRKLYEDFRHTGGLLSASRFFETEYRVDQKIWDFPKPVIALTHGITFGGGLGLIRGASHRTVSPNSLLSMPEVLIGLYPDVGATFFLQSIPSPERELLALCALRFGAREALDWGVATHCVSQASHEAVIQALSKVNWERTPHDHALATECLNTFSCETPPRSIEKIPAAVLEVLAAPDAGPLWDRALALPEPLRSHWFGSLLKGSPLSVALIFEQLRRGGRLSRSQAFEWEFHLSMACLRDGDFFEGVRCRLVEKGDAPRWKFAHPSGIPASLLSSILG
jgi:enoyl-CoA hydratase/carnithine racemase